MRRLLVALIAISGTANAQTSTTTCNTAPWGTIQCTTQAPQQIQIQPPPQAQSSVNWDIIRNTPNAGQAFSDAYNKGLEQNRQRELARREAQAVQEQADANIYRDANARSAAKLIAEGNCGGAEQFALNIGDLVLAKQVKDVCSK